MESKLKKAAMDNVGELPAGYPHLPNYNFELAEMVKQSLEPKAEAWNDAVTKPDHPCLCQTIPYKEIKENDPDPIYQYWTGSFFCGYSHEKKSALNSQDRSLFQDVQWREVQP